jgi:hypothetical protein
VGKKEFDFLGYTSAIEKRMMAWHEYSETRVSHSSNLGTVREHFVKNILSCFLPKSVTVGSGEIIGADQRSGQQDVVIYRSDFPVLGGFDYINTYIAEGVIATIEVKSDLSTGDPNGLVSAFKSAAKVSSLKKRVVGIRGSDNDFKKVYQKNRIATFVVGYQGWQKEESIKRNYRKALEIVGGYQNAPYLVYQPGYCFVKNVPIANLRSDSEGVRPDDVLVAFTTVHPFALFFQHLFRVVVEAIGGFEVNAMKADVDMQYNLDKYFSLPDTPATPFLCIHREEKGMVTEEVE